MHQEELECEKVSRNTQNSLADRIYDIEILWLECTMYRKLGANFTHQYLPTTTILLLGGLRVLDMSWAVYGV